MVWSRVGTSVPSTISTVQWAKDLRGRSAIIGPRGSMIRSAADFDTPQGELPHRQVCSPVGHDQQCQSPRDRLHGRPSPTASALSRRRTVTSFPKERGLSPVNGAIQDGRDAVINLVATGSSRFPLPAHALDSV